MALLVNAGSQNSELHRLKQCSVIEIEKRNRIKQTHKSISVQVFEIITFDISRINILAESWKFSNFKQTLEKKYEDSHYFKQVFF